MMDIFLSVAISLIQRIVDSELWSALVALVENVDQNQSIDGSDKRDWVLSELFANEQLQQIVAATSGWLINLALEAAVAKLKK